ncbi:MAG: CapA family protein, partial [Actinotalea sp.]|nr:CapA family protein [Actinotalea sp.]
GPPGSPAAEPSPPDPAGPAGSDDPADPAPAPDQPPPPAPDPPPPPVSELTLVAGGDVLLHTPVLASARTDDGGHDFRPLLAPLRPWVAGADLALCHLEVPVAPEGTAPSGYPRFGAPAAIARDLRAHGWDGCSTASNHSLDRGLDGVRSTLEALDDAGLGHAGTARTAEEAAKPQVYELDRSGRTVRVAHLAVTWGTNGIGVPASAPWAVQLLDADRVVDRATQARADGADLVVVSVHCCTEYVSEPTAEQERVATALAASGEVDLVLGHHAHVPQPLRLLPGGPRGEGVWVAYGLGNLISNQDARCCSARTDSGVLLTVTATVPPEGPVAITGAQWTAVTVDRAGGHRVHPLPATRLDSPAGALDGAELTARYERVRAVLGQDAPERVTPATPSGPPPRVVPRS